MDEAASSNIPTPVNTSNGISQYNNTEPQKHTVPRVLFIGDSISANVDIRLLSRATNIQFHQVKAYSSTKDTDSNLCKQAARFPHSNFTDVVPAELRKETFHSLVLQSPSVDITNLNTSVNPSKYINYFEQQTVISAKNFFSVVENALQIQPKLNKVIVLKLIPRYDPPSIDPLGLKSDLSKMFNEKLEELCKNSTFKSKIFVGSHNIDCTGAIRESRYWFAEFSNSHSIFIAGTGKLKLASLMGSTCMGLLEERLTL